MATFNTQEAIESALRHHQAGRLREAEQLYREVLARQPNHFLALHNLGFLALQVGQHDVAADLIRRAIAVDPNNAEAHNSLGNALKGSGRLDEAIAAFRHVVSLSPQSPEARANLGGALQGNGELDEAIAVYRQAIALKPDFPEAHGNLGNALNDKGQFDDAIAAYRQVIALSPDLPAAHSNLGNALRNNGQLTESIAACRKAISLKPNYPEAFVNLGNALKDKGDLDESIAAYRQAISLRPDYAEALSNLGNALSERGQLDIALEACRRAVSLAPNYPQAHGNLGNVLKDKGQLDEAVAAYHRAISLKPNLPKAHMNLGNALSEKGQLEEALAAYRHAIALRPGDVHAHSNLVYALYFHPDYDARAIAREHSDWERRHAEPMKAFVKVHANDRSLDRRLRIGYVSPDFRDHPVGRFLLPLLANHDHQEFEVFAYSQAIVADAMTERLRSHMDAWRPIMGLSDAEAADLIRQDRIDVLVDLTLHMAHNRLLVFARKPAPVQVTYLGYAGTTGLSTMDYRLSDPWLDPVGSDESVYSEQTIRLPETYLCYLPVPGIPCHPPPALETGFITFGCLNNFCKVNEPLLDLWATLLVTVPRSRLILHPHEGSHRQRVLEYLQRRDVEPSRVSFVGKVPAKVYFESYHSIDIALDTAPYGGGTTTCDALWMGVPVVSLAGTTAVGRQGLSILSNLGLPELVASTPEEYVRIAADLAGDIPRLQEMRSTLRQRMEVSPLMDAPRFTRNMEAVYRRMWRRWCERSGS